MFFIESKSKKIMKLHVLTDLMLMVQIEKKKINS